MPDSEISVLPPLIVFGFFAFLVGANMLTTSAAGTGKAARIVESAMGIQTL
jgi:hypothetical protein